MQSLANDFILILKDNSCRTTDSWFRPGYQDQGIIALEGDNLKMLFCTDKDELVIEFYPVESNDWPSDEYFTLDLLYPLITGEETGEDRVNPITVDYLKEKLDKIEYIFCQKNIKELLDSLR
ncbi:hypothetical protein [Acanthopleuribacter pedis]|uniref:Uncharacterized protein n=1 Tax=Acanthopleuribacter pedis TaxID=442870 RepID=A0A8J7U267_9BACT|nr:hypothetical protein [Acanthopleuribacter pedis]MBO1318287.1 hypothetical protein [Acanthopleuribacter pedis]